MRAPSRWLLLLVPVLLSVAVSAVGCDDRKRSGGDDDDDGGATGDTTTGTVTTTTTGTGTGTGDERASLTVTSAVLRNSVDGSTPDPGSVYLELDLTLANQSVPQALRVDESLFSVLTAANLRVSASWVSSYLDNNCSPSLSVAPGGSLSCGLVFHIAVDDQPVELGYEDLTAEVTLAAPIPTPQVPCIPLAQSSSTGSSNPACCSCAWDECVEYLPPPECTQSSCILGCVSCACEDECNVAACATYLEPFRACVNQFCSVYCEDDGSL